MEISHLPAENMAVRRPFLTTKVLKQYQNNKFYYIQTKDVAK